MPRMSLSKAASYRQCFKEMRLKAQIETPEMVNVLCSNLCSKCESYRIEVYFLAKHSDTTFIRVGLHLDKF